MITWHVTDNFSCQGIRLAEIRACANNQLASAQTRIGGLSDPGWINMDHISYDALAIKDKCTLDSNHNTKKKYSLQCRGYKD